jgi:hypothetical protein
MNDIINLTKLSQDANYTRILKASLKGGGLVLKSLLTTLLFAGDCLIIIIMFS